MTPIKVGCASGPAYVLSRVLRLFLHSKRLEITMARYYVYHNDEGPVEFFDRKEDADKLAADLNADIHNERTDYHVVDGSRPKYQRVW